MVGKFEAFDRPGNTPKEQRFKPVDVAQVEDVILGFTEVVCNLFTGLDKMYWKKAFITSELWPENVDILTFETGASVCTGVDPSNFVDVGAFAVDATDTNAGVPSGIDAGNTSEAGFGTPSKTWTGLESEILGLGELRGTPGNIPDELAPNDGTLGMHVVFDFETGTGTESLFNVGVNSGHNGDNGVNLEGGNGAGTGTNDESFNKRFIKSELLRVVGKEVDTGGVTGNCRLGTGVTVGGELHGRLGK